LPDLRVRDGDAPPLVLLSQEYLVDEIVEDGVFDPALLVERERLRALGLRLLDALLACTEPGVVVDVRAVHAGHLGTARYGAAAGETGGLGEHEDDDECDNDEPPDVLGGAAHALQHVASLLTTGCERDEAGRDCNREMYQRPSRKSKLECHFRLT